MYPNIALSGLAGSGKDTVAAYLVASHGYTRLALADPLKDMALSVDPLVTYVGDQQIRLTDVVRLHGWDTAKRTFPEVRRFLQHLGGAVREADRVFWLDLLHRQISRTDGPIVVTDVRYRNELAGMQRAGFVPVRITRPDVVPMQHASETELDGLTFTNGILNNGSIHQLELSTDALLRHLSN
jgi:hypothetical protein